MATVEARGYAPATPSRRENDLSVFYIELNPCKNE